MVFECLILFGVFVLLGIIGRFLPDAGKTVRPTAKPAASEVPRTATDPAPTPSKSDDSARQALSKHMTEGFGMPGYETTWYGNIVTVQIEGRAAVAHTDLDRPDQKARNICSAVSGFVFSNNNRRLGLSSARCWEQRGGVDRD